MSQGAMDGGVTCAGCTDRYLHKSASDQALSASFVKNQRLSNVCQLPGREVGSLQSAVIS